MIGYYNSGIPIHHHEGAHRKVYIHRVKGELPLSSLKAI
jgi:hypothetical protein